MNVKIGRLAAVLIATLLSGNALAEEGETGAAKEIAKELKGDLTMAGGVVGSVVGGGAVVGGAAGHIVGEAAVRWAERIDRENDAAEQRLREQKAAKKGGEKK